MTIIPPRRNARPWPRPRCLLTVELLEGRALLNGGGLDPTFNGGQRVTTDFTNRVDFANAVAVEPDGQVVVAGASRDSTTNELAFAVTRYNPGGDVDAAFGTNGRVLLPLGTAFGITVAPDGTIVVVGSAGFDVAVVRLRTDGTPDASFGGGDGMVTTAVGAEGQAVAAAVQRDGKIVVVGSHSAFVGHDPPPVLDLLRYNADGSLDGSFGNGGRVTVASARAANVVVQPDGKIVVTGSMSGFAVFRFLANGTADAGFGSHGVARLDTGQDGLADPVEVQADGMLVVGGTIGGELAVARLAPDGRLDPAFGASGWVVADVSHQEDRATSVLVQSNFVLVGGIAGTPDDLRRVVIAARFQPNGGVDSLFSWGGSFATPFGPSGEARDTAFQPDGKLLAVGAQPTIVGGQASSDFLTGRYVFTRETRTGSATQRYVQQLYLDLLGRPADGPGLAFWSSALDQGRTTRPQVVRDMERSAEFLARVVQEVHGTFLDRPPEAAALAAGIAFLQGGGTREALEAMVLGSDAFFSRAGGTADAFVRALYGELLARPADAAGLQFWAQRLQAGATRAQVAAGILGTLEAERREVQLFYLRYLHRPADPSGTGFFASALQQGAPEEEVIAALAGSDEYFGQVA